MTARTLATHRKRTLIVGLTVVGWLGLLLFAVVTKTTPIEEDLTKQSEAALFAAGIDSAAVDFDGRDATLTGTVDSEAEKSSAVAVVEAVPGVRVVYSRLEVAAGGDPASPTTAPPSTTPPSTEAGGGLDPPSFVMLVSGGTVALTGSVPDEAIRDAIVAGAIEAFGLENVVNRITVSGSVGTTEWLTSLPYLLVEMGDVSEFSLVVAGGTAELSGLAVNDLARRSIEVLVAASLTGLEIVNRLEIGTDPREVVQSQIDALDLTGITFDVGSASLASDSAVILDQVVEILAAHPDVMVEVSGHTDASGNEESNLSLSRDRADAVVAYLVSHGISSSRLTAVGYGSSQPIADNSTAEGRAANRRIEFVVLGAQ
jgi:OOP family OmpA-OmpF porin